MKEDNVVKIKSYAFAIRIVKAYKYLIEHQKEFVLSKQLLRSGTSIGSNIKEAIGGQSRKDLLLSFLLLIKRLVNRNTG